MDAQRVQARLATECGRHVRVYGERRMGRERLSTIVQCHNDTFQKSTRSVTCGTTIVAPNPTRAFILSWSCDGGHCEFMPVYLNMPYSNDVLQILRLELHCSMLPDDCNVCARVLGPGKSVSKSEFLKLMPTKLIKIIKVTLQITICLSIVVFLTILSNMIPTTSEAIPILGMVSKNADQVFRFRYLLLGIVHPGRRVGHVHGLRRSALSCSPRVPCYESNGTICFCIS